MARIDPSMIEELVVKLLEDVDGVSLVLPGEDPPEDAPKWCVLESVDLDGAARCMSESEPDHQGVNVVVAVFVKVDTADPKSGGSAGALQSAAAAVAAALGEGYAADEDTRHYVQMGSAAIVREPRPDEQVTAGAARVRASGRAERVSGTSLKTLP